MRTYTSRCGRCGGDIVRGYGEMGEGLLYELRCACGKRLTLGDWCVVVLAAIVLVGAVVHNWP